MQCVSYNAGFDFVSFGLRQMSYQINFEHMETTDNESSLCWICGARTGYVNLLTATRRFQLLQLNTTPCHWRVLPSVTSYRLLNE